MTNKEFKAWFEGFTEALSGTPTKAQWARIKERVAEIDGNPVTEQIYVDRYWPAYNGPYYYRPYWMQTTGGSVSVGAISGTSLTNCNNALNAVVPFNSTQAMYAAGKAEAIL